MKVKINEKICKACALCVRACPKKVLELGAKINQNGYNYAVINNEDACISCAACAINCPDMAITVYKEV